MQLVHLNTLSSEYTIELLTAKQAPLYLAKYCLRQAKKNSMYPVEAHSYACDMVTYITQYTFYD